MAREGRRETVVVGICLGVNEKKKKDERKMNELLDRNSDDPLFFFFAFFPLHCCSSFCFLFFMTGNASGFGRRR